MVTQTAMTNVEIQAQEMLGAVSTLFQIQYLEEWNRDGDNVRTEALAMCSDILENATATLIAGR